MAVVVGIERSRTFGEIARCSKLSNDANVSELPASEDSTKALSGEELLRLLLGTEVGLLLRSDPIARRGRDPEGVHQLRVGARRLRSELKILTRAVKPAPLHLLLRDLRWMGGVLGRQRDVDVLSGVLDDINAQLETPLPSSIWKRLRSLHKDGNRDVAALLDSPRYRELISRLSAAVVHPPIRSDAHKPALELVLPELDEALQSLFRAADDCGPSPTVIQLHRVRILAKKGRYCAETASPLLGGTALRLARELEKVQTVLGELHDYAEAINFLESDIKTPHASTRTDDERVIAVAIERLVGLIEEMKLLWREPLERGRSLSQSLSEINRA